MIQISEDMFVEALLHVAAALVKQQEKELAKMTAKENFIKLFRRATTNAQRQKVFKAYPDFEILPVGEVFAESVGRVQRKAATAEQIADMVEQQLTSNYQSWGALTKNMTNHWNVDTKRKEVIAILVGRRSIQTISTGKFTFYAASVQQPTAVPTLTLEVPSV